MNMSASIRTRGLAGPVMNARAGFGCSDPVGLGFSNPPRTASVALAGKPWVCMPWQVCDEPARADYVREQYMALYGTTPPLSLIRNILSKDIYDKDAFYREVLANPPDGLDNTMPVKPPPGATSGQTGSPANKNTVITNNPFPAGGGAMVPVDGGVQFRQDGTAAAPDTTGPFGLPAKIGGYPTNTVLGVAAAVLVAIAVAVAYAPERGRSRRR